MHCAGDICKIGDGRGEKNGDDGLVIDGGKDDGLDDVETLPPAPVPPPGPRFQPTPAPAPATPPPTDADVGSEEEEPNAPTFKPIETTVVTTTKPGNNGGGNNAFDDGGKKDVNTEVEEAAPSGGWPWWQTVLVILAILIGVPALVVGIGSQTCPEQVAPCLALFGAGKPKSKRAITAEATSTDDE